jgi:septal ring factor EnvC (AmiA/AmiB activator)
MKSKIVALLLVAGASLFAQSGFYGDRYYQRQDLRADYRDLRKDYAQVDRLRADIARDRYRLNRALAYGNEWQAQRIASDLARDQRALNALLADIARDHRDIRHDEREMNRDYYRRYR